MPRTTTTSLSIFIRKDVTMSFHPPGGSSGVTTLTIPPRSPWTSGIHWHETHTEYLQIVQGAAFFYLDGVEKIATSADGILKIPRYGRHEWRRPTASELETLDRDKAKISSGEVDGDLIVTEWTDPADGQKESFFRNLNSAILDITSGGGGILTDYLLMLQLFVIFRAHDNYPVVWPERGFKTENKSVIRGFQWVVTHTALRAAVLLGWVLGLKGAYDEYTPIELSRTKIS